LEDEQNLVDFLEIENRQKIFGYRFKDHEWEHRKRNWSHFKIEDFLIVEDTGGKMIACTLPWAPTEAKRMRVSKLSLGMDVFLRLGRILGMKVPHGSEGIKTLYLTHLTFKSGKSGLAHKEMADILSCLCFQLITDAKRDFHMLSWADEWNLLGHDLAAKELSAFVRQVTPVGLYSVVPSQMAKKVWDSTQLVGFEMALV
jgi:hypothetical protein